MRAASARIPSPNTTLFEGFGSRSKKRQSALLKTKSIFSLCNASDPFRLMSRALHYDRNSQFHYIRLPAITNETGIEYPGPPFTECIESPLRTLSISPACCYNYSPYGAFLRHTGQFQRSIRHLHHRQILKSMWFSPAMKR